MSKRRTIVLAILAALLLALVALPPRKADIFGYLPDRALAVGYHPDLRATWKQQLKDPVVASFLAGYDVDAEKAARESGAFWTFLLAVGEDVASAIQVGDDGNPCVAATSPTGRRDLLLHFFWFIRWVPGLGRIRTSPEGFHYIDLTDEDYDDPIPRILSVALGKRVLLAKLSDRPVSMADMLDGAPRQNGLEAVLRDSLPDGLRHRIVVRADIPQILGLGLRFDRDTTIDVLQRKDAVALSASFPVLDANGPLAELLSQQISGRNASIGALAADHAFLLALLPQGFAKALAGRMFGEAASASRAAASADDAAIYLTAAPYGAKLFVFAIPAITASFPGLTVNEAALKNILRPILSRQMRSTIAVFGENTVCSSAASLAAQRHADPAPEFTWRNAFGQIADARPSAYFFIDCDSFFRELRQIAQAIGMASSFARDAISPEVSASARNIAMALPDFSTSAYVAAAISRSAGGAGNAAASSNVSPGGINAADACRVTLLFALHQPQASR